LLTEKRRADGGNRQKTACPSLHSRPKWIVAH
jgi:hypothetical protein